jgi:hypothetical protein
MRRLLGQEDDAEAASIMLYCRAANEKEGWIMRTIFKNALLTAVVFTVVLLFGSFAVAGDYCIYLSDFDGVLVGKSFSLPGKGKCKPFQGYIDMNPFLWAHGEACGSSDGTIINFNLSLVGSMSTGSLWLYLYRDTLTGYTEKLCLLESGEDQWCHGAGASKVTCPTKTMPIP